jgi:hypothetical protein
MISPFVPSAGVSGDGVDVEMGSAGSGVQCENSHIGGAKSNRFDAETLLEGIGQRH